MFGMLDYRAHKLYWLLALPLRLLNWCATIAMIFASCLWASSLVDNVIARFVLAYVIMQVAFIILTLLWTYVIVRCFDAVFNFFIDVEPAGERTREQAKEVLTHGKIAIIFQKPHSQWTTDDCASLLSNGWIGRVFFSSPIRKRQQILCQRAQKLALEAGSDVSLSEYELTSLLKAEGLEQPWYEIALTHATVRSTIIIHLMYVAIFIACQN